MSILELAKAWVAQDPDPKTRSELQALIDSGDQQQLDERFQQLLQFGTAGLRGELGAGPNRMNRVVVSYAALAIAKFLVMNKETYKDPEGELTVVVGFDGRENSDIFARDSAEIFQANGCRAMLFDQAVPTPVAAFTGKRLAASATIVVTASHNPPRDNGYKVYLGGPNGNSQLISPQDQQIAQLIEDCSRSETFSSISHSADYQRLEQPAVNHYIERARCLISQESLNRPKLKITHTALHGVGWSVVNKLFTEAGFTISAVPEQMQPDGAFPTVAFPNPEEAGAMDLAYAFASNTSSDLILANDPDADRLAVAVPLEEGWRMLTGDQVGLLLADYLGARNNRGTIANSIVSASLAPVAKNYNLYYEQTLTGFKWISKVPNLVYGYEEALGYCVDPEQTPDKDGITAALLIAELAADLKAEQSSLSQHLDTLEKKYGQISTGQVSIRVSDLTLIDKVMQFVRSSPPKEFDGALRSLDLAKSEKLRTDAVIVENEVARLIFRPSGTEPKLKCYLQFHGDAAGLTRLKEFAASYLASAQ
jgi:phosphomannomutase